MTGKSMKGWKLFKASILQCAGRGVQGVGAALFRDAHFGHFAQGAAFAVQSHDGIVHSALREFFHQLGGTQVEHGAFHGDEVAGGGACGIFFQIIRCVDL